MSAQEQAKEGPAGWGSGWVKCVVASFVIAAVFFFVPWSRLVPDGVGVGEIIGRALVAVVLTGSGAVMYPLGLVASWVKYEGLVLVGFVSLALLMGFEPKPERKWALGANVALRFYAMFGIFMGFAGIFLSANSREIDFFYDKKGTKAFELVDAITPAQVKDVQEAVALSRYSGQLVLDKVLGKSGVDRGRFGERMGYDSGSALFLSLFETEESLRMSSTTTGPVCSRLRKNYLESALVDRYVLTIGNVPVSAKTGQCDWRWNTVEIRYRPSFLAK